MIYNLSTEDNNHTARTNKICAEQRAENLAILGVNSVLELCVGPSLKELEKAYSKFNIKVIGNDIDHRWKNYYPKGKWIIGDARNISTKDFDAVVVAPPLSKGCTGTRENSLSLEEVAPNYTEFLHLNNKVVVFVLPGRTLSLKEDKNKLYKFLSRLEPNYELIPLVNKVTKYIDIYWIKNDVKLLF